MNQWFFDNIPDFQPVVGFHTQFNVKAPSRDFMHQWQVTEVRKGKKISYSWKYQDIPGEGKVTFEIIEEKDGTRLRLTNLGLETFPRELPEFKRESCIAGWDYFIKDRLKEFLKS